MSGAPIDRSSAAVLDDPRRLVALEAVHNFRDLGGYRLPNGRTTKWGRIYRADGLHRLTDADLDVIDRLGIRTVIDLRTPGEVADRGRFPIEKRPVTYHHLSIIDATWTETGVPEFEPTEQGGIDFLVWAYRDMLAEGGTRLAEAVRLLSAADAAPAVFHCAAGKDRTGLLAMLILGGLGVDHEVIAADFGLTLAAMDRLRAWLAATNPQALADMQARPPHMSGAHPDAMRQILRDIVADHGTVAAYLATVGVDSDVLQRLADHLT
jgi:protein-tyrosine phosphatase